MIKVITVDRECRCGGLAIAQKLADRLGWKLWDRIFTEEIARLANCELAAIEQREERRDPLYYRLFKSFLRGSYEANLQIHRLAFWMPTAFWLSGSSWCGEPRLPLNASLSVAGRSIFFTTSSTLITCLFMLHTRGKFVVSTPPAGVSHRRGNWSKRWTQSALRSSENTLPRIGPIRTFTILMINTKIGDEVVVATIVGGIAELK
jgi:hypothetical protein